MVESSEISEGVVIFGLKKTQVILMETEERTFKDKYVKLKRKYKALQSEYSKTAGQLEGLQKSAKALHREKNFL